MKKIDKQLEIILYHIEKLKSELEKYLLNYSMRSKENHTQITFLLQHGYHQCKYQNVVDRYEVKTHYI